MNKALFTCLSTLIAGSLSAQEVLSDRWKEVQRLDPGNKPVAYSDTLRLLHVSKEEMSLRRGSFLYKGRIDNDLFSIGDLEYGIVKKNDNEIRLRDEEFIHVFSQEAKDMSAADAAAGKAAVDLPATPVAAIDKSLLQGSWEAYKRTSRKGPLQQVDYKTLIKSLSFQEHKTSTGYGSFTADITGGSPLYTIQDTRGADIVALDQQQRERLIKVWRLTATELVIEDDAGIVYYLKHFR